MGCTLNPKKTFFGLIHYNGPHNYEYRVSSWAYEKFQFTATCKECGSSYHDFAITFDEMVAMGFDLNFLRAMKHQSWGTTEEEWKAKREQKASS